MIRSGEYKWCPFPSRKVVVLTIALLLLLLLNVKQEPSVHQRKTQGGGGERKKVMTRIRRTNDGDLPFVRDGLRGAVRQVYMAAEGQWSRLTMLARIAIRAQEHSATMRSEAIRSSNVPADHFGVTKCIVKTFAQWVVPQASDDVDKKNSHPYYAPFPLHGQDPDHVTDVSKLRGAALLRIEITQAASIDAGVHVAPCSAWEKIDDKPLKRLAGSRLVYTTQKGQRFIDIIVNASALLSGGKHSNLCFLLQSPNMCQGDSFCRDTGSMTLTAPLFLTPTKPTGASGEASSAKERPPTQEILVVLLESLSWDVFNQTFQRTHAMLEKMESAPDASHRVSRFVNSHANGQYTALNHPPLLFGRHASSCASIKGLTVGKPCEAFGVVQAAVANSTATTTGLLASLSELITTHFSQIETCVDENKWRNLGTPEAPDEGGILSTFFASRRRQDDPSPERPGILIKSGYRDSQSSCGDDAEVHSTQFSSGSLAGGDARLPFRVQQHLKEFTNTFQEHLLFRYKHHRFNGSTTGNYGFKTGFLAPLRLMDDVMTCYSSKDESSLAMDDSRIRYFHLTSSSGLTHSGVQGCVGDRHEMDHQDEFIHSFFNDPNTSSYGKQQNKIAVLNHQVAHGGISTELGRYYDARLEQQVRHFIENAPEGVQRTVLLQADHGESVKADRHILNPVSIWITPRSGPFWERNGPVLHRRRHAVTSHFDEHATLLDFLERYPFDGKPEEKEDPAVPPRQVNCKANPMRHRLSMLDATIDVPLRRSCEDLGLFSHSCNLFDEVEVVGGGKGGGVINSERLRAGLVHLLAKRAAGYVSSMFAAPVATRHKNSSGDDEGAGREHFGPCKNLPQMMVSASTKPEAERFVEFESVSARLFSDGTCALAGRVALATKPRRSVFIFNVEPIVSLVEDGMSVEERARRCVTAFVRHRRKRVTQMIRVSRFAPDEDACGSKLESFWASSRAATTGKAKAPHMMYCVCNVE